jgi:hypothetical protein
VVGAALGRVPGAGNLMFNFFATRGSTSSAGGATNNAPFSKM